jgi:peptidyl-prolyl cis-trans isomerase D
MFDAVRNNKRIVQLFLVAISLPFALWGVDSYVKMAKESDVAVIGGHKITQQEFKKVWGEQTDRMRRMLGNQFNPEAFNTPAARQAVLNDLIVQRLLLLEAINNRMGVSDETLRETIAAIPAVQENGQFSLARYEAALKAQGLTQAGFEQQMRQNLTLQQLVNGVGGSAFVVPSLVAQAYRLQAEERVVQDLRLTPEGYTTGLKLADGAAKEFYDKNPKLFEVPEQGKAEFVVLSLDSIPVNVPVEEMKAWYESHKDRYQQGEERRASHILLTVDAAAPAADKAKVKAHAEQLLAELRKNPAKFADLAKQNSQDPGSASKGGDLGFFGHGMMVKPFEDTVFKLKDGDLSGVVESEFGYHIIKLTGIKGGKGKSFEDARPEIEAELKKQAASRKFAEAAETFSNMVYEQSDSLQPVADKFKLTRQTTNWLPKNPPPQMAQAMGPLGNPKLLSALFSEDSVKGKRNTEAVEVAQNTLIAARLIEHKPASLIPFETVKAEVEKRLLREEADKLAKKAGADKLAALSKDGGDKENWGTSKTVSRLNADKLPPVVLNAIFKADTSKLPAYAGVELPGAGYVLFKIVKVEQPEKADDAKRKALVQRLTSAVNADDMNSYTSSLRSRYKVEVHKDQLESKDKL